MANAARAEEQAAPQGEAHEKDAPLIVEGDLVVERDVVLDHLAGARVVLANGVGSTVVYEGLEAGVLVGTDEHLVSVLGPLRATVTSLATSAVLARLAEGKALLA